MRYQSGSGEDYRARLEEQRHEDLRLRQTTVGPHRDEIRFSVNGRGAEFASEGQQRTMAISLKLALARLLAQEGSASPVLLIDDVFGELDFARRGAFLGELPAASQRIITTTHMGWLEADHKPLIYELADGKLLEG